MFIMSTSLPFMLVVGIRPKIYSTLLRGICSRREDFVYPEVHMEWVRVRIAHEASP